MARALDCFDRHQPVVLTNLGTAAPSKWGVDYLAEHTTDWPQMNVLSSSGDANRYLYYNSDRPACSASQYKDAPQHACKHSRMTFRAFLQVARQDTERCHYLQQSLVTRTEDDACPGGWREDWCPGIDAALREDCLGHPHRFAQILQQASSLGPWCSSQLFVGPDSTLSTAHYDQYDNVYLQVRGSKHFLLFDPAAAGGLCPFPVCHPHDRHAMLDLEQVDDRVFPGSRAELSGRGLAATVEAGEYLYLPSHWWHHVQGCGGGDGGSGAWSISVSFWFGILHSLLQPPHPLPQHLELELARHAELLLVDVCGSGKLREAAEALEEDVQASSASGAPLSAATLPARNFVLHCLARLLGPAGVADFLSTYMASRRFDPVPVMRALRLHAQGMKAGSTEG